MLTLVKGLVAGYLVLLCLLVVLQRQLLFHPQPDPGAPTAYELPTAEVLTLETADGLKLKSWYVAPQPGQPVLVQFHGNASSLGGRAYVAVALAQQGYGALLVGYRGYNGNPGHPSEQGLYADARANLDWLVRQGLPFVLHGESLGTGIAVQMALEYPHAKAVILEAPYTSIPAAAQYHYWYVPARWLVRDRFDSLSKIGQVHQPVLIIHGERDATVPLSMGRALFAAALEPKQALWLAQAEHTDLYTQGAQAGIFDFLAGLPH